MKSFFKGTLEDLDNTIEELQALKIICKNNPSFNSTADMKATGMKHADKYIYLRVVSGEQVLQGAVTVTKGNRKK
jgi:hypothetical protein